MIHSISTPIIEELLMNISKGFASHTKNGEVVYDYSSHMDTYHQLLEYVTKNYSVLNLQYNFSTDMNYGEMVQLMLNVELACRYSEAKKK